MQNIHTHHAEHNFFTFIEFFSLLFHPTKENEIECREQKSAANGQEEVAVAAYKMAYIASTYSFESLMMIMNVHEHGIC